MDSSLEFSGVGNPIDIPACPPSVLSIAKLSFALWLLRGVSTSPLKAVESSVIGSSSSCRLPLIRPVTVRLLSVFNEDEEEVPLVRWRDSLIRAWIAWAAGRFI